MRGLGLRLLQVATGRGSQGRFLGSLRRAMLMTEEELAVAREKALKLLLRHACTHVRYYRAILQEMGGPSLLEDFPATQLLHRLPLLTKSIIHAHWDDLKSDDLNNRKWYENASGGSTGEPVRFIQDALYHMWSSAGKALFDEWTGYRPGQPRVLLWGSERDLFVGKETVKTRFVRWLRNERWLNSFRMTEDDMRRYVDVINDSRPVQLLAYVDAIYELARFIEREGLHVVSPRAIMTSAGTLYPHMRETIEKVFRAPVFNRYGSREVGDIACDCSLRDGLHMSPLTHYVEILREDGSPTAPGEEGEVVVTALRNYAMPLIRYRLGDTAVWSEDQGCECGCNWPKLKQVTGRLIDVFVRRDGTKISPLYFIHMVGVVLRPQWLQKFQVIQEDFDFVRLLIVPAEIDNGEENHLMGGQEDELRRIVRTVLGDECRLEVQLVDEILPTPSGKHRYVVSKVAERELNA